MSQANKGLILWNKSAQFINSFSSNSSTFCREKVELKRTWADTIQKNEQLDENELRNLAGDPKKCYFQMAYRHMKTIAGDAWLPITRMLNVFLPSVQLTVSLNIVFCCSQGNTFVNYHQISRCSISTIIKIFFKHFC